MKPIEAVAKRDARERELTGVLVPWFADVMREVIEEAGNALTSSVLLAGARDPFAYTNVMDRWYTAVRKLAKNPKMRRYRVVDVLEASDLPASMYDDVAEVLRQARNEGWTQYRTKRHLSKLMIPKQRRGEEDRSAYRGRIVRLARTLATRSLGEEMQEDLSKTSATKRWVAVHDERTRSSHLDLDGVTVPVDVAFSTGTATLMYPGDPTAPASETINCRCVMVAGAPDTKETP